MNATKIASLVLICIVALACATSIGLALLPNFAPKLQSKTSPEIPSLATTAKLIHPMGDPIDDPRPNKNKG